MSEYTDYQQERGHLQVQDIDPVPVHIASSGATPVRDVKPEFATCYTFSVDTLTNMGQPIRLLSRRYRRDCAKIIIGTLGPSGAAVSAQGTANAPAANTQIVLIANTSIQPGLYNIEWEVGLSGTPGANEADNFQLRNNAATLTSSVNGITTGEYSQSNYGPIFLSGANGVSVRSGAAVATAGSIYLASITLQPIIPSAGFATIVLNSKQEHLMQANPVGAQILAPIVFDWENQQPLYAVLTPSSSGPVLVAVIDQAYEET